MLLNSFIVSSARGDVTGDRIPDNVFLTGIKTQDSPFIQKITLVIQDGRTRHLTRIPLLNDAGYNPTVVLRDFTYDRINDIFISITSGGSGGITYYFIYSDVANIPKLIFDFNVVNEYYKYDVIYNDYYKVDVINKTNKLKYIIDISNKDKEYLNEIYDNTGKLKAPITGFVNPLSGLYPIDFEPDGVYELLAFQKIAGRYNADALGYIQTVFKWNKTSFNFESQTVAIFGSEYGYGLLQ